MMKYCNKIIIVLLRMDSRLRGNDRKSGSELFAEKLHKKHNKINFVSFSVFRGQL